MKQLLLFSLLFSLFGCGNQEKKHEGIYFSNDLEDMNGWCESPSLTNEISHSGKFSSKTDTTSPFGQVFKLPLKSVSKLKLKKVRFTAMCYYNSMNCEAKLVVNIGNSTNPSIYWNGFNPNKSITEPKKWTPVSFEFDISNNNANDPENNIMIYVWNTGKDIVYNDDLEIEFFE